VEFGWVGRDSNVMRDQGSKGHMSEGEGVVG